LSTVTVSGSDVTLPAGSSLSVIDADGVHMTSPTSLAGPSLTIAGALDVAASGLVSNPMLRGVDIDHFAGFFQNSVIDVTSTGSIRVNTAGTFDEAEGIGGGAWAPHIVNDGTILVEAKTHAWGIEPGGLEQADQWANVVNHGDLTVTSEHQATGIALLQGGAIENSGHIAVSGTGGVIGLWYSQWYSSLVNTGDIVATDTGGGLSIAVQFGSELGGGLKPPPVDNGVFRNDGLIQGDVALKIYQTSFDQAHDQVFVNDGRMVGDIQADLGGQTIQNNGAVQGAIDLGADDDVYDGRLGNVSGMVSGGAGDDSLAGGAQFDALQGNAGNDTEHGNAGDDIVVGGKDNDVLYGDAGNDIVWGNLGNDTLDGGDGTDQVRGGQGDDVITGGAGDDWLSGDRGSDTVTGGAGADAFHFFSGAGVDRVTDFHLAEGDHVLLDPGTNYTVSDGASGVVISTDGGDQMTLLGVHLADLHGGWIATGW